jgi:NAD-dependent SIR2 family protein deacetylase
MGRETTAGRELYALERVRCLECGTEYSKPERGGTANENPGCPRCGYLGWLSASIPLNPDERRRRSGADLQQRPDSR